MFIEGWFFLFLAITGIRAKFVELVPRNIMLATSAGIGFFLAHIGLQSQEGLGIVTHDPAVLVGIGECGACGIFIAPARGWPPRK